MNCSARRHLHHEGRQHLNAHRSHGHARHIARRSNSGSNSVQKYQTPNLRLFRSIINFITKFLLRRGRHSNSSLIETIPGQGPAMFDRNILGRWIHIFVNLCYRQSFKSLAGSECGKLGSGWELGKSPSMPSFVGWLFPCCSSLPSPTTANVAS